LKIFFIHNCLCWNQTSWYYNIDCLNKLNEKLPI